MAVFAYTALAATGRTTSVPVPADNKASAIDHQIGHGLAPVTAEDNKNGRAAAIENVVGQGLSLVTVEENKSGRAVATMADGSTRPPPSRVPQSALESFTRELANLLAAGLPLSRALHLLRREVSHPGAKHVWSRVHDDVVGGKPLAEAMAAWPKVFSSVYVAMVRAGEAGGFLHIVLQQIADFRTREQELKGKVKAAMVYPCVLACLAVAVLVFLLTFFIPRFSGIFAEFGSKLPALTRVIVTVSGWLMHYGWLIAIVVAGLVVMARRAATSDTGLRVIERIMLRTPAVGTVAARFALVRFCRMLGTLVGAGVPLVNALRVA